ncbi:MAG: nicotinate phosphoribosyltransferase, partial [Usitatibacter sp.]
MRGGQALEPRVCLEDARDHARLQLARLPEALRSLEPAAPYDVQVSPELRALADQVDARRQ